MSFARGTWTYENLDLKPLGAHKGKYIKQKSYLFYRLRAWPPNVTVFGYYDKKAY